jgi:hypothetical protein
MQHIEITAANHVPFTFVYIPAGEAGPNPRRHPADSVKATVEIYDARHKNDGTHPLFGQFTGGHYYVDDFLGEDGFPGLDDPLRYGLNVHGGVDDWTLDGPTYRAAREWVANLHD